MSLCCNVDETPQELNSCLSVACGKIGFAVCHFAQVAEPTKDLLNLFHITYEVVRMN